MNEGYSSFNHRYNHDTEIYLETEYKLNALYKILWLILWPVYIFKWVTTLGYKESLKEALWESRVWYYKAIMWHEDFYELGDIKC